MWSKYLFLFVNTYLYALCLLIITTIIRSRWIMMTTEIESDEVVCVKYAIFWFLLELMTFDRWAVVWQRLTKKLRCGGKAACCRCKLRYVSKSIAASHGSPCDSMAFLHYNNSGHWAFTARYTIVQSAVLRLHVVCTSVCPSVTLVDQDHVRNLGN